MSKSKPKKNIPPSESGFDAIATLFKNSEPTDIEKFISTLAPLQITAGILALNNEEAMIFQTKLMYILSGLKEISQLEAVGRALSTKQLLSALALFSRKPLANNVLSPILVGLSPQVFFEAIYFASDACLLPFKQEGLLEPLEHHLNHFIHESEKRLKEYYTKMEEIAQEIAQINCQELSNQELHLIRVHIEHLKGSYHDLQEALNKALAIAWKTNRIDLIENLSHLKEIVNHQLIHKVGTERTEFTSSTGLFAALEEFLFSTYGSSLSMQKDLESLSDTDLAIEGLTKLSVWYLKDYWEVGLLPSIVNQEELSLSHLRPYEKEWLQKRQEWFNLVQKNLEKLGIGIVSDLKKANIFSKKMLKEFIIQHQSLINDSV